MKILPDSGSAAFFELLGIFLLVIDITGQTDRFERVLDATRRLYIRMLTGTELTEQLLPRDRFYVVYSRILSQSVLASLGNFRVLVHGMTQESGRAGGVMFSGGLLLKLCTIPLGCLSTLAGFCVGMVAVAALFPERTPFAFLAGFVMIFAVPLVGFIAHMSATIVLMVPLAVLFLLYESLLLLDRLPGRSVAGAGLLVFLGTRFLS